MSSQTSWSPPSRLWLKCNRLLRLGRPVGAVTLSRWEWWWNERWIWGARRALNLIATNYPDHGLHGRLPLSRKNAHGRAGNRTRDLMVRSQEVWPPSHEAGQVSSMLRSRNHSDISPLVGILWTGIGPSQRPLPVKTQYLQETHNQSSGGVRTRSFFNPAVQTHTLDRAATGTDIYPPCFFSHVTGPVWPRRFQKV